MSDAIKALNEELARELTRYRDRVGAFDFELCHEQMGRSVVLVFRRDGLESDRGPLVTLSPYLKAAYREQGRTPFTIELAVSADGVPGEPVLEFDRPPRATQLRVPALYVQELERRPRPPGLVPGWMKVELAALGAWDLRTDGPTWKDLEPTGEPQTPESVGIAPPPGAEWALGR